MSERDLSMLTTGQLRDIILVRLNDGEDAIQGEFVCSRAEAVALRAHFAEAASALDELISRL